MTNNSSVQPDSLLASEKSSVFVVSIVILVMFLWAICFPLISWGLEESPPLYYAALRAFIAGMSLLIPCWLLRRPRPRGAHVWLLLIGIGLTTTSVGFYGMYLAGGLVTPGLATVLANTQPIIALIIAYFVLSERLGRRGIAGILIGFLGIVLIGVGDIDNKGISYAIGIMYIILSAIGVAIGNVALKRLAGQVDVPSAMGWQLFIGSIPLLAVAVLTENSHDINWSTTFIATLLSLSLFGTSLVFVLWFWLLKQNDLGRLNVFSFLTTGFGLLLGLLFFDETFGVLEISGIVVTLIGISLVGVKSKQR
ncbi:MAG: DMT family transporter [Thiohalomonadales bacterium]